MASVLVDLTAAFDSIDHKLLNNKLKLYGIEETARNWIFDYMTGRSQSVDVDGQKSTFRETNVGVPQGSILGPLMYTIFMNEFPSVMTAKCDECSILLMSERNQLFLPGCVRCGQTTEYADDLTQCACQEEEKN